MGRPHLASPCTFAVAFFFLVVSVLAAKSSNGSQHATTNTGGGEKVDQTTVQKYQSLLDDFIGLSTFDGFYTWNDIIGTYTPANADCSARCVTCAPGCNPACCAAGLPAKELDNEAKSGSSTTSERLSKISDRGVPIEPLVCPCHCEDDCPATIRNVCCSSPSSSAQALKEPTVQGVDTHQTILDGMTSANAFSDPFSRIWGRPNRPLVCGCACGPGCPAWMQAICCTTPGSGSTRDGGGPTRHTARDSQGDEIEYEVVAPTKLRQSIDLITQTGGTGRDAVAVLAAMDLSVYDSFITLDLVRGLQRDTQISYSAALKGFEVTLPIVYSPAQQEGQSITLAHTFAIVDGAGLLDQNRILLGAGFMSRVGGLETRFKQKKQAHGVKGVPLVTGTIE